VADSRVVLMIQGRRSLAITPWRDGG
jgi:hypothetical protein